MKSNQNQSWTSPQSVKFQLAMVVLFFVACFTFLFVLEARLSEQQKQLEFNYQEYYLKPFHYKLDPFSYIEIQEGVPITEPEPPSPRYMFSFEELLLNRFADYFLWTRGPTLEADVTLDPAKITLTIQAFAGHMRNRLYYRLERDDLRVNPILLTDSSIPKTDGTTVVKPEDKVELNKLVWNTIPYCTDPILEDALHELGNINGFLYSRGNHNNFRFLDEYETKTMTNLLAKMPVKFAYLYDHNYLNFTRFGWKDPVHVSIVCEPIDRKLRHFYTERFNYREWSEDFPIAQSDWWKMSLEECMNRTDFRECKYEGVKDIKRRTAAFVGRTWLPRRVEWTLPQFCDYDRCNELGVKSDLDYVKESVERDYTVVGTLERLDDTLDLLEAKVPQFFKGIKEMYRLKAKVAKKKTYGPKIPEINATIKAEMEKRYAPEINFYRFVAEKLQRDVDKLKKGWLS